MKRKISLKGKDTTAMDTHIMTKMAMLVGHNYTGFEKEKVFNIGRKWQI